MRNLLLTCLLSLGLGGYAFAQSDTQSDARSDAQSNEEISPRLQTPESLREKFVLESDLSTRLQRLLELEQQALQLAEDEPLKLGSLGAAILDIYYGSQTGHFAMGLFYAHVESAEAKAPHDAWLAKLQTHMLASGNGTRTNPYTVMTIYDAHTYARTEKTSPVGSIYQSSEDTHFGLMLVARPTKGTLRQMHFDLSHILKGFALEGKEVPTNPWPFMRLLASKMDNAAQTAIGAYLTSIKKYEQAISWLKVASRTGNVLANTLLARIYWTQAEDAQDDNLREQLRERALENHMHAIALGSTDSMYTLANLYLNDYYGEENRDAGIPLLSQAGDLDHAEALLYLGHLYNAGLHVEQDSSLANNYFLRAAKLNNPQAILSYGRFLSGQKDNQEANPGAKGEDKIYLWLEDLAKNKNSEAMIVLGNLYARGIGKKSSIGKAIRWYKRAVKIARDDGDIVNEVAWTLTVSDVSGLKREKYAQKIMNHLMANNTDANTRPEYLDTWAATFAARGDFDQAIELQQKAISVAQDQQRDDVIEILREHLEQFKSGIAITERAP